MKTNVSDIILIDNTNVDCTSLYSSSTYNSLVNLSEVVTGSSVNTDLLYSISLYPFDTSVGNVTYTSGQLILQADSTFAIFSPQQFYLFDMISEFNFFTIDINLTHTVITDTSDGRVLSHDQTLFFLLEIYDATLTEHYTLSGTDIVLIDSTHNILDSTTWDDQGIDIKFFSGESNKFTNALKDFWIDNRTLLMGKKVRLVFAGVPDGTSVLLNNFHESYKSILIFQYDNLVPDITSAAHFGLTLAYLTFTGNSIGYDFGYYFSSLTEISTYLLFDDRFMESSYTDNNIYYNLIYPNNLKLFISFSLTNADIGKDISFDNYSLFLYKNGVYSSTFSYLAIPGVQDLHTYVMVSTVIDYTDIDMHYTGISIVNEDYLTRHEMKMFAIHMSDVTTKIDNVDNLYIEIFDMRNQTEVSIDMSKSGLEFFDIDKTQLLLCYSNRLGFDDPNLKILELPINKVVDNKIIFRLNDVIERIYAASLKL